MGEERAVFLTDGGSEKGNRVGKDCLPLLYAARKERRKRRVPEATPPYYTRRRKKGGVSVASEKRGGKSWAANLPEV